MDGFFSKQVKRREKHTVTPRTSQMTVTSLRTIVMYLIIIMYFGALL